MSDIVSAGILAATPTTAAPKPAPKPKAASAKTTPKAGKGKPAAKAKPAAAKHAGNGKGMGLLTAAYTILKGRSTPLGVKELVDAAVARKLWTPGAGLTPAATLAAAIITEIAKKGKAARFVKVGPGQYTANKAIKG